MSRRGSYTTATSKRLSDPHRSGKRSSLRDNQLSVPSTYRHSLGDIREGDTYYKTVHIFPSVSDVHEVTVSIARTGAQRQNSATPESRRGSIYSESRAVSPMPGGVTPLHGIESPMQEQWISR